MLPCSSWYLDPLLMTYITPVHTGFAHILHITITTHLTLLMHDSCTQHIFPTSHNTTTHEQILCTHQFSNTQHITPRPPPSSQMLKCMQFFSIATWRVNLRNCFAALHSNYAYQSSMSHTDLPEIKVQSKVLLKNA